MEFLKAIFGNIIGIDGVIIIITICNIFVVGYMVRKLSTRAEDTLKKVVYKPIDDILSQLTNSKKDDEKIDLHKLKANIEKEESWYQIFISVTSILPLMGILGTVISLLGITAMQESILQANFMTALSSTFWGIIGAIICRVIEGTLTPIVDRNKENFDLLINRVRKN